MPDDPIPTAPPARSFGDAELDRLLDLLEQAPEAFAFADPSVLDGLITAVLVQPVLVPEDAWLARLFEPDEGEAWPAEAAEWRAEFEPLLRRRAAEVNRAIVEDGWFEPLVFGFDAEHPPEVSEYEPYAALPPVSQALAPWVEGFFLGLHMFPALEERTDDLQTKLAPLLAHRVPDERPATPPAWNPDDMMAGFDAALDAVINAVVALADETMGLRYKVDTIRRAEPKVGRNDPCPCGSGKKYKRCHGAE